MHQQECFGCEMRSTPGRRLLVQRLLVFRRIETLLIELNRNTTFTQSTLLYQCIQIISLIQILSLSVDCMQIVHVYLDPCIWILSLCLDSCILYLDGLYLCFQILLSRLYHCFYILSFHILYLSRSDPYIQIVSLHLDTYIQIL